MLNADNPLAIPERVRLRAEQHSPQTQQWLQDLPARIHEIEQDWQIRIGPALSGGSAAFVAPAVTADGAEVVVKFGMPGNDFPQEVDTLRRAEGRGYVKILRYDLSRDAMLLEALGPTMQSMTLSPEQCIVSLCQTLEQTWQIPPAPGQEIEYKASGLSQLITELWEQLDRPCPESLVERALEYAERRIAAFDPARCVVVHGDPHPGNALAVTTPRPGAKSGFVFVDPDGFLCEPEYDLGVVLRDWCPQLLSAPDPAALAHTYCRLLAQESGLSGQAIWEWGFIERVSTGLYITAYGSRSFGQPFFDTATRLL